MSFFMTFFGILLLLVSLAGVALGLYMAADQSTRGPGVFFALWWVTGAAAAGGVLMRDVVTFAVGALCFVVAGAVFSLEGRLPAPPARRADEAGSGEDPEESVARAASEKTTKENKVEGRRRAAS